RERQLDVDLGELLARPDRRVANRLARELLVRDHDARLVARPDVGVGEPDLLDDSALAGDLDLVTEAQRLRERDQEPGDDVRERALRGEADDEPDDGRR